MQSSALIAKKIAGRSNPIAVEIAIAKQILILKWSKISTSQISNWYRKDRKKAGEDLRSDLSSLTEDKKSPPKKDSGSKVKTSVPLSASSKDNNDTSTSGSSNSDISSKVSSGSDSTRSLDTYCYYWITWTFLSKILYHVSHFLKASLYLKIALFYYNI